jgi:hypothetical protein
MLLRTEEVKSLLKAGYPELLDKRAITMVAKPKRNKIE